MAIRYSHDVKWNGASWVKSYRPAAGKARQPSSSCESVSDGAASSSAEHSDLSKGKNILHLDSGRRHTGATDANSQWRRVNHIDLRPERSVGRQQRVAAARRRRSRRSRRAA
jgi:hypothetical protein